MWILHFIPDSLIQLVIQIILATGLLLTVITTVGKPLLKYAYSPAAQFIGILQFFSVLILIIGVFFEGGYATEMEWRHRVEEVQAKVEAAEAKSKEVSVQINTKVVTRTKVIHDHGQIVRQYIDREVTKYDNQCVIPDAFVKAHNDSAEAPK
jgi:hypothetical protein